MANTLHEPRVASALKRMFAQAEQDEISFRRVDEENGGNAFDPARLTAQQRADVADRIYMPVSADAGRLLYSMVRAARPATVVEFGTSYGISTLHLAAAVRDNGTGQVVTTEMSATKAQAARRTFTETGLDDVVTLLEGDALETLADLEGPVGLLLLDGWKELYLPVLKLLEPQLAPGALVAGDDLDLPGMQPYLDYVRDPGNGYESITFPVEDGVEISCRV
ncbi:O-methyltransferase [Streptomyces cacaoi]|uniref:O-methyltransferase n=1 Tax=Streptomyces cacaoi TaxID=1898 RepID=UPI0026354E04|nr:class I SAM-dependent methyltransferase [Streptomyces cacaoi]